MVTIKVYRNDAGEMTGFAVNGHANTAPYGQDIVCASVAVLTQTAVLGLERHLEREIDLDIASGKLAVTLVKPPDALTGAILETMFIGLADIAESYPKSVRIAEHRR